MGLGLGSRVWDLQAVELIPPRIHTVHVVWPLPPSTRCSSEFEDADGAAGTD